MKKMNKRHSPMRKNRREDGDEGMAAAEGVMLERTGHAGNRPEDTTGVVRDGFVLDFISGTREVKETPKELVRQRIARALFHEYGRWRTPSVARNEFPTTIYRRSRSGNEPSGRSIRSPEHENGAQSHLIPLRIFISSVQGELAEERVALRDYIRGDALFRRFFDVFLFEDAPATDRRPDRLYLDEVERCPIYVGLFGLDYGSEDEEGISPTEREFARATGMGAHRLADRIEVRNPGRLPTPLTLENLREAHSSGARQSLAGGIAVPDRIHRTHGNGRPGHDPALRRGRPAGTGVRRHRWIRHYDSADCNSWTSYRTGNGARRGLCRQTAGVGRSTWPCRGPCWDTRGPSREPSCPVGERGRDASRMSRRRCFGGSVDGGHRSFQSNRELPKMARSSPARRIAGNDHSRQTEKPDTEIPADRQGTGRFRT